eukprot:14316226-Ditylum_brightwellii.AAC.1
MKVVMIKSYPPVECVLSSATKLVSHTTKKNVSKNSNTLPLPPVGLTDGIVPWQLPVAIWDVYNKQSKEAGKRKMLPKLMAALMLVQRKDVQELHKSMLLAYIFATSDKKTCCGLLLCNDYNKSGKNNHNITLECVEASMVAAYTDQNLCCCSAHFQQRC